MELGGHGRRPKKDILYTSGQISSGAKGQLIGVGDLEAQATQAYANLLAILRSQGRLL